MVEVSGGCLCGSVRYTSKTEPLTVRACWCRDCQYWSGGNAMINVVFDKAGFELTGQLTEYESKADSGNLMRRGFCRNCGTDVTSGADVRPNIVIVRAGSLDNPSLAAPQMTIFTNSAPDWAEFNASIPSFEGMPTSS